MGLTVAGRKAQSEEHVTGTMDKTFEPPETRAGRNRRRRRRISLATAVVVLAAGAVWAAVEVIPTCGRLGSGVYRVDGECVGVTDGSVLFYDEFADVEKKIADENAWVETQASYVTVALLNPLTATATSALTKDEILGQLEGAYIAQYRINHTTVVGDVRPPIKLVLANEGSTQSQWRTVVRTLVEMASQQDNPLVAVAGMGISICRTEQAARELASNGIPMVGAAISATGLEYSRINGLIRVSPDVQEYVQIIDGFLKTDDFLKTRPGFRSAILVYDVNSDSNCDVFAETLRTAVKGKLVGLLTESNDLGFPGGGLSKNTGASQFASLTPNICAAAPASREVVILYAGRRGDLPGFLDALRTRICSDTSVVVISTGTDPTAVLRAREKELRDAKITVYSVTTTNAMSWDQGRSVAPEKYPEFRRFFAEFRFNPAHLSGDRVMTMHDAVLIAAKAVRLAAPGAARPGAPTAVEVRDQLMNLHDLNAVPGASGTLSFSYREPGAGNPRGKPMFVVQFPSATPGVSQQVGPPYFTP